MQQHGIKQKKSAGNCFICTGATTVHKKILLSFCLLILLTSALSIFTVYQVKTYPLSVNTSQALDSQEEQGSQLRLALQKNIVIVAAILIVSLCFAMVFLIRSIANPLQKMEISTRGLAEGDLDQLMPTNPTENDPIGKIGENVHDLAINLQEILLLIWNLSAQDIEVLEQTVEMLKEGHNEETRENAIGNLRFLERHRQETQSLVQQFELFNVTLQGKKLLAKDDSANQ